MQPRVPARCVREQFVTEVCALMPALFTMAGCPGGNFLWDGDDSEPVSCADGVVGVGRRDPASR